LLEMLRSGWVQTGFIRNFVTAANSNVKARLTGASWQLLLLFTIVVCIILFPVSYIRTDNGTFLLARRFTLVWLAAALPYQLLQWQLLAQSQFKKLAVVKIVFTVSFTVVLMLRSGLNLSVENIAAIYAGLLFLPGIAGLIIGWLKFGIWRTRLRVERRKISGFGKYSMFTMAVSSLLRSSDQFIIAIFLGPAAVAVYAIPQKLIEAIEIPVRSFASVMMPKATSLWHSNKIGELRMLFYKQFSFLTLLTLPLLLSFFIYPSYIVNLLGGGKYHESALLLRIFCFYAALIPLDRYCGVLLDAGNRPRQNAVKVLLMLVINVMFDIAALWFGAGLYGVAAGSTITFLVGIVLGWVQLKDILEAFRPGLLWREGVVKSLVSLKNAKTV